MLKTIYKICHERMWWDGKNAGLFRGTPIDLADGFIHFSTASQVRETAAKHFAGQNGLLLIAIDEARLSGALKYEASRGGALFPHLYAPLDRAAVIWAKKLPLDADGNHEFPELEP